VEKNSSSNDLEFKFDPESIGLTKNFRLTDWTGLKG